MLHGGARRGFGEGTGDGESATQLRKGIRRAVGSMEGHAGQNGIDDCDTIAPEGMVQLHDHSLRLAVDGLGVADIVTPVTHARDGDRSQRLGECVAPVNVFCDTPYFACPVC